MACIRDQIPVRVMREREVPAGQRVEYDVLGLATPVGWLDGYFIFAGHTPDGQPRTGGTIDDALQATAAEESAQPEADDLPPGASASDDRTRVRRDISRQGQGMFRSALKLAYGGRCAVTGAAARKPTASRSERQALWPRRTPRLIRLYI
jgi:hypothetical protein